MRILGIDHGNTLFGHGLIDYDIETGDTTYVESDYHFTGVSYPHSLHVVRAKVTELIDRLKPDILSFESPKSTRGFIPFQRLVELLGNTKGICIERGIPYVEIPPSTLKKMVAGHGFATKAEVADALSETLNLDLEQLVGVTYYKVGTKKGQIKDYIFDGTDALGLAVATPRFIKREGRLDYEGFGL